MSNPSSRRLKQPPVKVNIFIEEDGSVTFADLFAEVLPIAIKLDPDNKRLKGFMDNIRRISHAR